MTYCGPMSCPQNDPQGEICFKVECNQGIPYPSTSQWPESTIEEEPMPTLAQWSQSQMEEGKMPPITACDLSEVCERDRVCPFFASYCRLS